MCSVPRLITDIAAIFGVNCGGTHTVDHERLIQITARLLLEKHGERAQSIAAQRAQEWVERQDGAAALFWLSISDAVGQLQAATVPKDASMSLRGLHDSR